MTADDSADSRRVWVVDDDRSVRFVLATALRDAGYEVDGFENAASALAALRVRGAPDLLFTDVRMPGDDGLVLLDRLKSAHPQLPVIVMSAYTDVASTASAFRGGAHEFLSKPFDLDDAVALAARTLPDAEEAAEAAQESDATPTPQLIGDTPAHQAMRLARLAAGFGRRSVETGVRNMAEYLAHERGDLVPRAEAEDFYRGVERLREDLDRLDARTRAIEQADAEAPEVQR